MLFLLHTEHTLILIIAWFPLAADIYDDLDALLEDHGLVCECLGGGKITHNSAESLIEVSGKSQVWHE